MIQPCPPGHHLLHKHRQSGAVLPYAAPHQTGGMTIAEVIGVFARAWDTGDQALRLRLLASCCLPDAAFVSPQATIAGTGALAAGIAEFRRAFPAAVGALRSPRPARPLRALPGWRTGIAGSRTWLVRTSPSWPPTGGSGCWSPSTALHSRLHDDGGPANPATDRRPLLLAR